MNESILFGLQWFLTGTVLLLIPWLMLGKVFLNPASILKISLGGAAITGGYMMMFGAIYAIWNW